MFNLIRTIQRTAGSQAAKSRALSMCLCIAAALATATANSDDRGREPGFLCATKRTFQLALSPGDLNASRFGACRAREFHAKNTVLQFRLDTVVVHFVTEDERPQEVADVVLLMQHLS